MDATLAAMAAVFGLGVAYFIAAVPAGIAMGLSPLAAGAAAWAGYAGITVVTVAAGEGFRNWIARRWKFRPEPDPSKLVWRVWSRWGLPGLALLAPVTVGPYITVLIALALGERPGRTIGWVCAAAVPWTLAFALAGALGVSLFRNGPGL